jgi:type II secretory pathway pseudopilin PulG
VQTANNRRKNVRNKVSIIALLTALGVTNFMVANKKARDGKRQSDLEQIRAALEIYRSDERIYPTTGSLNSDLEPNYMGSVPSDPTTGRSYSYTSAAGATYTLCASLELSTAAVAGCGSCGTGFTCNYKITNPL